MIDIDGNEPAVVQSYARIRCHIPSSPRSEGETSLVIAIFVELPNRITRAAGSFHADFAFVRRSEYVNIDAVLRTQLQRVLRCLQQCFVMLLAQCARLRGRTAGSDAGNGGDDGGSCCGFNGCLLKYKSPKLAIQRATRPAKDCSGSNRRDFLRR